MDDKLFLNPTHRIRIFGNLWKNPAVTQTDFVKLPVLQENPNTSDDGGRLKSSTFHVDDLVKPVAPVFKAAKVAVILSLLPVLLCKSQELIILWL